MKNKIPLRKFRVFSVSAIGYGVMGLTHGYGKCPEKSEAIRLLKKAYSEGCNFFDTAEAYSDGKNEELLGEAFEGMRDKIVIATKVMLLGKYHPNIKQEIEEHLDRSLKRLRTNYVDCYYLHRMTDAFKIEEVAEVMGYLIKKGKIKGWGISAATPEDIRKANAVTRLSMVQNEFSLMERTFENCINVCEELDIGFICFAPMGNGFLSGKYNKNSVFEGDDIRRAVTRFKTENIIANQPLLDLIKNFADKKGVTMAQISLAWILKKSKICVPIPGMRTDERIVENLGAANIELTDNEYNNIENELKNIKIYGDRKDSDIIKMGYIKSEVSNFEKNKFGDNK